MNREEKQLDATLEAVSQRVSDIKNSIGGMLQKLEAEYETLNWTIFLDNFALISGQLNSLLRLLKNDRTFPLRSLATLPLLLSPDRDEDLVKLTENRVSTFTHDLVPNYLRTKLDPDVEKKHNDIEERASQYTADNVQKQVNQMNKAANHVIDQVNSAREEWENEAVSRASANQTFSPSDTNALVAAVGSGKGLKQQPVQPGPSSQGQIRPSTQSSVNQPGMMSMGKAPSAIKTNIKSAAQMHPYSR